MRNLIKTSALTIAGVIIAAGAAVAGENSVYNRYEHKTIYGGQSETTIDVDITNTIERVSEAQSIKVETYGGDTNLSIANYDGKKLTGRAVSTNNVPVDPVSIITTSSTTETVNSTETIKVDTVESHKFRGTEYEHSVGTRF